MKKSLHLPRPAFTLIELLLVLTILAILAGIVLPKYFNQVTPATEKAVKANLASFNTGLSAYEIDNGAFPSTSSGLQALLVRPHDANSAWKGPYMDLNKIPLDPWGHAYVYQNPGKHNPAKYDLYSLGRDGLGGTNLIGNWQD